MSPDLHRQAYVPAVLDELVAFCQGHPTTGHPPDLVHRLIGHLPADASAVMDIWQGGQRRLVGVVLDTLDNSDHAAIFDVLGWDGVGMTDTFWPTVLNIAEDRVRSGPRQLISFALSDVTRDLAPWLLARGYHLGFTSYGMATAEMPPPSIPELPQGWHWEDISPETVRTYYEAVCAAMGSVPGTNIAAYADFAPMALQARLLPRLLLDGDQVAGFFRVTLSGGDQSTGYISAIGRTPTYRGRGLGPLLLATAMNLLADHGARRYTLDVSATNAQALRLYERHGFRIVSDEPHFLCTLTP
jgi:ribosomal protein S18 acetylase RimI-like enzyme